MRLLDQGLLNQAVLNQGVPMSVSTSSIRILVVENHPAVREALIYQFQRHPDLLLVAEAATVAEARELVAATSPDVAIVDISLHNGDGIELVKRLREQGAATRILVWSTYEAELYADRARRAGAHGYITKEHPTADIVDAIRRIHRGETVFDDKEEILRASSRPQPENSLASIADLSDRELEVFRMLGEGLDMARISERLNLSVKTVETYRARIKQKLNIDNRMELIHAAVKWVLNKSSTN